MNMLIIGNGFDLAHDRPTTYADFLKFLDYILLARDFLADKSQFENNLATDINCCAVKEYILSSFDTRRNPGAETGWNKNTAVQELYECLDNNIWYEYFCSIHKENKIRGNNWIDFEGEIREIIEFLDRKIVNIYDQINCVYDEIASSLSTSDDAPSKLTCFCSKINFTDYKRINKTSGPVTYFNLIEKTYQDLQRLIRCLEIYLDDCVGKMPILHYSPDIWELDIDYVLSFNYTSIPLGIYPSLNAQPHNIHGCAEAKRLPAENNMVLGVNEYWVGDDKNTHTNFNLYKKFVQRIIKETGIDYKRVLRYMQSEDNKRKTVLEVKNSDSPYTNHFYIFGHSLDITDGDILREIIETDDTDTTIFYRDKQQQANQIANLSKVLGQDELLKRTFSISPTIIFKKQADMKEL